MKKRLTYFIVLKIIDYSLYCKNFHVTNYLIERMFVWSLGMWLFYLPNVSYVDRSYKSTQKVLRKTRQHQKYILYQSVTCSTSINTRIICSFILSSACDKWSNPWRSRRTCRRSPGGRCSCRQGRQLLIDCSAGNKRWAPLARHRQHRLVLVFRLFVFYKQSFILYWEIFQSEWSYCMVSNLCKT